MAAPLFPLHKARFPLHKVRLARFRLWMAGAFAALCGVWVCSLGTSGALAQEPQVCAQIRAEFAALPQGAGRDIQRARAELAKVQAAIDNYQCLRRRLPIFGGEAPVVCGPLLQEAAQLRAVIASDSAAAHRAQLEAAYTRYGCAGVRPQAPQAQPETRGVIFASPNSPSLFEHLFNPDGQGKVGAPVMREVMPDVVVDPPRYGGGMPVCVRTCDGFYFPVNFEGVGRGADAKNVCAALCPASATQVYYMAPHADISTAGTADGAPYTALPTAGRYRQHYDSECICKGVEKTWAQLQAGHPDLVEARKGDIVVTEEQAAHSGRPRLPGGVVPVQGAVPRKTLAGKSRPEGQGLDKARLESLMEQVQPE